MSRGGNGKHALELEITPDLTIPKVFEQAVFRYGDKVAMREKEYGIWRPLTWNEYLDRVKLIALGLVDLGLKRGDKVSLIGDNRPEGLWAEMAVLAAGGVAVWLYQESLMDEVQFIVDHSDSKFMIVEGQEEVDKALAIKDNCPKLQFVVWDDPKGLRRYDDPILKNLDQVMERGREIDQKEPHRFGDMVKQGTGEDVALLFYTSGTTSAPKGALLTHWNMLKMGQNLMRVDPAAENDDFVSFLPFAWIGEQMMSISCGIQAGFTINFPEEPESSLEDLREIAPQMMFSSARLYEQMVRGIQVKYADSSWAKRKIYEWGLNVGYALADNKFDKKPASALLKIARNCRECDCASRSPRSFGFVAHSQRLHRRLRHRSRPFSILSRDWRKPEANLRTNRNRRHFRFASHRRCEDGYRWQADSGNGSQNRRGRRDSVQESGGLQGLLQER